jgi:hypothetical protein
MSDDGRYHARHTVTFSKVSWYEKIWHVASFLPGQAPLFATVTVSFWGVAEVLSEIGGETLSLQNLAIPALTTAFIVASYRAALKYINYVPESLMSESKAAKVIYQKGRFGWQFALAKEMLLDRLGVFDRTLKRVYSGAEFIRPKHLTGPEYLIWLQTRPELLQRLIHAVSLQCTSELPSILARIRDESGLEELKDSVVQLMLLYEEAANLEVEARGIKPPTELSDIHELVFGWSDPIREGVGELLAILDRIGKVNPKRVLKGLDPSPDFEIVFSSLPNIDKFLSEVKNVNPHTFQ